MQTRSIEQIKRVRFVMGFSRPTVLMGQSCCKKTKKRTLSYHSAPKGGIVRLASELCLFTLTPGRKKTKFAARAFDDHLSGEATWDGRYAGNVARLFRGVKCGKASAISFQLSVKRSVDGTIGPETLRRSENAAYRLSTTQNCRVAASSSLAIENFGGVPPKHMKIPQPQGEGSFIRSSRIGRGAG